MVNKTKKDGQSFVKINQIIWKYLHKYKTICAESISTKTIDQGHILWVGSKSLKSEISGMKKKRNVLSFYVTKSSQKRKSIIKEPTWCQ
jgi:hypothetical protein